MNIAIQKYLPHRQPMQMVDTITQISETDIKTLFFVAEDCIFVENNHLCESGLIENMAQTCSAVVGQFYFTDSDPNKRIIGYISAIKSLHINQLPEVLQTIRTDAEQISRYDAEGYSLCGMQCNAYHNDTLLASAEMNLFIKELSI